MISSMTAFARSSRSGPLGEFTWELRSVNHRYLELSLRLPDSLRGLESRVRDLASRELGRGKVDIGLRYVPPIEAASLELNEPALQAVISAAMRVRDHLGTHAEALNPLDLLRWPGVVKSAEGADQEALENEAMHALQTAFGELKAARRREGERLAELIEERAAGVLELATKIGERIPAIREAWRDKLRERIAALGVPVEPARLEQELVLAAQKGDIAEELDRIGIHVREIRSSLHKGGAVGRRLDFLMQELGREANTIGSKAFDMEITQAAVGLKVLIEQMREQIQNIE
jgi:uncharacterized protein (TIGR00255 family)